MEWGVCEGFSYLFVKQMGGLIFQGDIPPLLIPSPDTCGTIQQPKSKKEETGTIFCPPAGTILRKAGREKVPEKNHSLCLECGALYMPNHVYYT